MEKAFLGKSVVTLTGGNGGYVVLSGLKSYPFNLTAVSTTFDSGKSTGRIRDEFGDVLPAGDIRRCLWALRGPKAGIMARIFDERLKGIGSAENEKKEEDERGVSGHPFGNLALLFAEKVLGSRIEAIRQIGELLDISGTVLPVSMDSAHIHAELCDGTHLEREHIIDQRDKTDERTIKNLWLEPDVYICKEAAEAIMAADAIVLGPGDLYSSLVPMLRVRGIAEAIRRSQGRLICTVSLMTKPAETRGFSAFDFVSTILACNIGRDKFDAVIYNSVPVPDGLRQKYWKEELSQQIAEQPENKLEALAHAVHRRPLLSETGLRINLVRHDSAKLARCIADIVWSA